MNFWKNTNGYITGLYNASYVLVLETENVMSRLNFF
jgi:hypothetical protein